MSYIVDGLRFHDKKLACVYYGVKCTSVNYRMSIKGETLEEAIHALLNKKREYVILGKKYEMLKDIAEDFRIDKIRFYGYMNKYNKENDDSLIEEYVRKQLNLEEKEELVVFGKHYKKLCDLEREFKLARNQLKEYTNSKKKTREELEDKIRHIMYKRYIINKVGTINIVRIPDSEQVVFVLDSELDRLLLYKEYDETFYRERELEEVV